MPSPKKDLKALKAELIENLKKLQEEIEGLTVTQEPEEIKDLVKYTKVVIKASINLTNSAWASSYGIILINLGILRPKFKTLRINYHNNPKVYNANPVFNKCKEIQASAIIKLLDIASNQRLENKNFLAENMPSMAKDQLSEEGKEFPEILALEEFSKIILTLSFEQQQPLIKALSETGILSRLKDKQDNNFFLKSVSKLIKDGQGENFIMLKDFLQSNDQGLTPEIKIQACLPLISTIRNPLLSLFGLLKLHELHEQQLTPADKALVNKYFEPEQPIVSETLNDVRPTASETLNADDGFVIVDNMRRDDETQTDSDTNESDSSTTASPSSEAVETLSDDNKDEGSNVYEIDESVMPRLVINDEPNYEPAEPAAAAAPASPALQEESETSNTSRQSVDTEEAENDTSKQATIKSGQNYVFDTMRKEVEKYQGKEFSQVVQDMINRLDNQNFFTRNKLDTTKRPDLLAYQATLTNPEANFEPAESASAAAPVESASPAALPAASASQDESEAAKHQSRLNTNKKLISQAKEYVAEQRRARPDFNIPGTTTVKIIETLIKEITPATFSMAGTEVDQNDTLRQALVAYKADLITEVRQAASKAHEARIGIEPFQKPKPAKTTKINPFAQLPPTDPNDNNPFIDPTAVATSPASQDESDIAAQSPPKFPWKKIGMLALAVVAVGVAAFFAWPAIAAAAGIAVAGGVIGTVALLTTAAVTYGAQKIHNSYQSEKTGNEVTESFHDHQVLPGSFVHHAADSENVNHSEELIGVMRQENSEQDNKSGDIILGNTHKTSQGISAESPATGDSETQTRLTST